MYEVKRKKSKLCKYIFGQTVEYEGIKRKIKGIRFACDGVMYQLTGLREWIKEGEIT